MTETLRPAKMEHLHELMQSVMNVATQHAFPDKLLNRIELTMEEALVNVIDYSYPDKEGDVLVKTSINEKDKSITITVVDSGIPFDVTDKENPDLTLDLEHREIGGLGIFLIRKLVDSVEYSRKNDQNLLSVTFKRSNEAKVTNIPEIKPEKNSQGKG